MTWHRTHSKSKWQNQRRRLGTNCRPILRECPEDSKKRETTNHSNAREAPERAKKVDTTKTIFLPRHQI